MFNSRAFSSVDRRYVVGETGLGCDGRAGEEE